MNATDWWMMKQFGLVLWFLILYAETAKSDVGSRTIFAIFGKKVSVQKEDVHTTCLHIVNVCFVCVWIWKNSRGPGRHLCVQIAVMSRVKGLINKFHTQFLTFYMCEIGAGFLSQAVLRGDGEDRSSFYSPRKDNKGRLVTYCTCIWTATLIVSESLIWQDAPCCHVRFRSDSGIYGLPVLTCCFCRFFLLLLGGPWGWSVLYFLGFFMVLEVSNRGSRTQPRVLNRSVTQPRLSKTVASLEQGVLNTSGLGCLEQKFLGGLKQQQKGLDQGGRLKQRRGSKEEEGLEQEDDWNVYITVYASQNRWGCMCALLFECFFGCFVLLCS